MFTDKAQGTIDLAKDYAFSGGSTQLTLQPLLMAMVAQTQTVVLLAECLGLATDKLRAICPEAPAPASCPGKLSLDDSIREMLGCAKQLAEEVPDRLHPGLIDIAHLSCAVASSRAACAILKTAPMTRADAVALLAVWFERQLETPKLEELTERIRAIRTELLSRIFGQDHAIHMFVEGLFNAEVVANADMGRRAPKAIFVFAGPPGVGKTFLAEQGAAFLKRPFKRFDMSAYSGNYQNEALVGLGKGYHGAHPGLLTEFVEKNPDAVLLFDEIEKSHSKTIHLFLQILDIGVLEDKYHERNASFRNTVIIFTTNAGRKLYDRPNESGVNAVNAAFHRKTILDALATEVDPETRQPFFPAAICSRMATGYPVLFNHLRVNELERVVRTELVHVGALMERQYYKRMTFHDLIPMALVLREGARADARTLRSQTEAFAKSELFKFCQLFKTQRLEEVLQQVSAIRFMLADGKDRMEPDVAALFDSPDRPHVLLVADLDLVELYRQHILAVEWRGASTADEALRVLAEEDIDMVLLDLWLGRSTAASAISETMTHFDHVPAASRGLDRGQELLRKVRERLPYMPVFLLSLAETDNPEDAGGSVDEELFMACVRGGGARGMVVSRFIDAMVKGWEIDRDKFAASLLDTCHRLYLEKAASKMGQERKVLAFDTAPHIDKEKKEITIRLRNLRLTRAIAAADAGEILEDVERPRTKFADVIGAQSAKEELQFFIEFLRNPRRFAALGLKPPKGVLLYGPPGTGKTMLARAMAGESNVAFIPASAANFVTIWQGSGPQSIRDLFDRARRYAPAIVFIDEIDAIGKTRSGGAGANSSEENTLNALLTEMDGFKSPSPDRPLFILAATNFKVKAENPDEAERETRTLDPALVRRFSRKILVDRPDTAARKEFLVRRFAEFKGVKVSDSVIDLLAEKSIGMGIGDIEHAIEAAGRKALQKGGEYNDELLVEAFEVAREGEAKEWDPKLLESTARHEAGHTVMYWLSGWWATQVDIIARAEHGGGMTRCEAQIKRESWTRDELLSTFIRTCLGGRAAEMVYYGQNGLSSGASSDLEVASNIARKMISELGMDSEFGLLSIRGQNNSGPLWQEVNKRAGAIVDEQLQETLKLLQENRGHLDAVSQALIRRNRLYRKDLQEILPPLPRQNPTESLKP